MLTRSHSPQKRNILLFAGKSERKNFEEIPPIITVLDTSTNRVVANWELPKRNLQFRENLKFVDTMYGLAFSKDLSFIYDYNDGVSKGDDEPAVPASVTVFSLGKQTPVRQITFPFAGTMYRTYENDHRGYLALSPDERWLYIVETGRIAYNSKKRRNGRVHVIDVRSGRLVNSHDIGYNPLKPVVDYTGGSVLIASEGSLGAGPGKLYRFTDNKAPREWALHGSPFYIRRADDLAAYLTITTSEIVLLNESGDLAYTVLRLKDNGEHGEPKLATSLKNLPGHDFVAFPKAERLVLGTCGLGGPDALYPEDDVAVIDLKAGLIQRNLTIGRGSVKFGKGLAAFSLSMAVAMASGYAAYSVGSPAYISPVFGVRSGSAPATMVPNPNHSKAWVLNSRTNDVTIIDPVALTDTKKIAVGTGCGRIMTVPGTGMAAVVCDDEITLLDLQEEKVIYKSQFGGAKVYDVGWDEHTQQLVALTSRGLTVLSDGKVKAEIAGLHEPMLLVQGICDECPASVSKGVVK